MDCHVFSETSKNHLCAFILYINPSLINISQSYCVNSAVSLEKSILLCFLVIKLMAKSLQYASNKPHLGLIMHPFLDLIRYRRISGIQQFFCKQIYVYI